MSTVAGFPYREVQYTKNGDVHDEAEVSDLLQMLTDESITDLLVLAHGWNNDMPAARALYASLLASLRSVLDSAHHGELRDRSFAVLGVLWPSRKFSDPSVIASGAASAGEGNDDAIEASLDNLKTALDDLDAAAKLDALKAQITDLELDPSKQRVFADTIRNLLPRTAVDPDDASSEFFRLPGDQVMERMGRPLPLFISPTGSADVGGAAGTGEVDTMATGGAAFLGGFFAGAKAAALNLLNYSTYYLMKERAGVVGRSGLYSVLHRVREHQPSIRLHLIGHSFGGRLVASAGVAAATAEPPLQLDTLTLLQAAFSHHGFAAQFDRGRDGFFRPVITAQAVSGPILITHTPNDTAVGSLYPLASLLAGDDAASLGDAKDPFGGIGRNGAQKTPEAVALALLAVTGSYQFLPGVVHNLEASEFVADHGAVTGREIAYAILTAIATT